MANFVIDKSRFNDEQLAQYEALVAIGKAEVDPEANKGEMEEDTPPAVPPKKKTTEKEGVEPMETKKSAPEQSPEIKAALEELANLKKSFEMKEMTEVAKKYAPLGKKEDELAKTLYDMKKSNEANFNAYITILDESLAMVEKSGIFAEIGKSASNSNSGNSIEAKVDAKAQEIMKSENCDYVTAVAKAWDDPALAAAYDESYFG